MLLIILNMKNHGLLLHIALIQRLFRDELEVTRCATGVMNVFKNDQLFLDKMLLQISWLLLLASTFENLLQVFLRFHSCKRVMIRIFFWAASQTFGTFVRLKLSVAVLLLMRINRGTLIFVVILWISLVIWGRIVLDLSLFLFLQPHDLPSRKDFCVVRRRLGLL